MRLSTAACSSSSSEDARSFASGARDTAQSRPRSAATSSTTFRPHTPRTSSARESSNTTYRRGGHAIDATPVPEPVAQFAATCGTKAPTYSRERPGMSAFVLSGEDTESRSAKAGSI
jgi:hypothetical protein